MTNEIINYTLEEPREEDSILTDDDFDEEDSTERLNYRFSDDTVDYEFEIRKYDELAVKNKIQVFFEGRLVTNWTFIHFDDSYLTIKKNKGIDRWKYIIDEEEDYRNMPEVRQNARS